MKIGDKVRFLSEVGGGRVAGFQGKNIVLVEDADGFEIPMSVNEVVVVDEDDYSTERIVAGKKSEKKATHPSSPKESRVGQGDTEEEDTDPADKPITFKAKPEERRGGNLLSAYLAFVPLDSREISKTSFEAYFVNDSNYYLYYAYYTAEGANWHLRSAGEVEPNTKVFIEEFERDILNELEHVGIQLVAYKRDKAFIRKPVIDVDFRIDTVKFYKLHTFQENDFFDIPALIYPIVENDHIYKR